MQDDRFSSTEQLARYASELTDYDVRRVGEIVGRLVQQYSAKTASVENLNNLRDEALTRLAEIGILATLDPAPVFSGEPPTVEIVGKVTGHDDHKYGFDHERKQAEVRRANELGEDYRGQKEKHNG